MSSAGLSFAAGGGKAAAMEKKPDTLSREERLAAKLRENLKRRKAQARNLPCRLREGQGEGLSDVAGEE
jgi:hypothetical protein